MPLARHHRYQEGSIAKVKRAKGPDVWVFRWRELLPDGKRVQRKQILGNVTQLRDKGAAKAAAANLRTEINAANENLSRHTIAELWGHFQREELHSIARDRSPTTIECYLDNFRLHILPRWGDTFLDEVKAPAVENWLASLSFAPATKAKLRNQLSALYSHAIRHEWFDKLNPIATVRQSSKRQSNADILTLDEMRSILAELTEPMHRVAVLVAAVTGLRRSEIRGLCWRDVRLDELWLDLRTGVVRSHHTKLKTDSSRKGVPIPQDLADELRRWRTQCLYPADTDWVFASPDKEGKSPVWLETVLPRHIQPAAKRANVTKDVGWHTFRRSLASILSNANENVKVVQELLRHSNSKITMELYQQAGADAKRSAQAHVRDLFVVKKAS